MTLPRFHGLKPAVKLDGPGVAESVSFPLTRAARPGYSDPRQGEP